MAVMKNCIGIISQWIRESDKVEISGSVHKTADDLTKFIFNYRMTFGASSLLTRNFEQNTSLYRGTTRPSKQRITL